MAPPRQVALGNRIFGSEEGMSYADVELSPQILPYYLIASFALKDVL